MAVNTLGFVQVGDFGQPRMLTGEAMEIISGGQFVSVSGTTGVVGSQTASYAQSDIKFIVCDAASSFVGIAMQTVASGNTLAVCVDGNVLVRCAGSVLAGKLVEAVSGADAVATLGSQAVPTSAVDASIAGNIGGKAYTAGASGGYALVHIKP